jgi:hypothetical protein
MPSGSSKRSAADNSGKDSSTSKKNNSGKDSSTSKKNKSGKDSSTSKKNKSGKSSGNRASGDEDFAVVEEYTDKAKVLQRSPALHSSFLTPQKDKNTPTPKSKK